MLFKYLKDLRHLIAAVTYGTVVRMLFMYTLTQCNITNISFLVEIRR